MSGLVGMIEVALSKKRRGGKMPQAGHANSSGTASWAGFGGTGEDRNIGSLTGCLGRYLVKLAM